MAAGSRGGWRACPCADRSGFYWLDDEQKELILASKAAYQKDPMTLQAIETLAKVRKKTPGSFGL